MVLLFPGLTHLETKLWWQRYSRSYLDTSSMSSACLCTAAGSVLRTNIVQRVWFGRDTPALGGVNIEVLQISTNSCTFQTTLVVAIGAQHSVRQHLHWLEAFDILFVSCSGLHLNL